MKGTGMDHEQRVLEVLHLSQGELSGQQFSDLLAVMLEAAVVFALDSSEIGCTNIIQHTIDTGDHPL